MAKQSKNKRIVSLFILFFLFISLPLLLIGFNYAAKFLSRAAARPANIVIDAGKVKGPLPKTWQAIAQGGEEQGRTFWTVRDEIRSLSPRYIRIDHIYDGYDLVQEANGQLILDWSQLDQTVFDILSSGALPFFSLSYMPAVISEDGSITGRPADWQKWSLLVKKTIEHYSGRPQMNLAKHIL